MKKKILIILGFLLMFVVSCGGGKHPAVKAFEDDMKMLQSGDLNKNASSQNTLIDPETMKAFGEGYKKITYKINKTTTKGDEAIINVTMKAPNLSGLMEEYIHKAMNSVTNIQNKSDEEMQKEGQKLLNEMVTQKLSDSNLKYIERTFDVVYKKSGDRWIMSLNTSKEYAEIISLGMLNTKQ